MTHSIPFLAMVGDESFVTELRHMPEGWFAVAGLALLAFLWWAVSWMYRTEGRVGASARVRGILAVIRGHVLSLPRRAIRMTWTALPITSAGRFSPLGPRGML